MLTMVNLTLFGNNKSPCTQRVLILLEELQLKYNLQTIDLKKLSNSYLELQPFGKTPLIQYGDHIIYESRAILRYIAKNNVDDLDLTLGDNVNVDMWLEVESQNFNPHISKIVYEKSFAKNTNEYTVKFELTELKKILSVYDHRLSEYKYIAGNEYSIADISHIPYINLFIKAGYKSFIKDYPYVYKWFKRLIARDAVKFILEDISVA